MGIQQNLKTACAKAARLGAVGAMAIGVAMTALPVAAQAQRTEKVELTVRADKPGETIHRNIYGQFMEHLGRGIYEGIWVGEDSDIPNTDGYRNDVMAALKDLKVPLVRWPGGCFADEYHWRDGIGPRAKRPKRVNTHWGGVIEDNSFGTHEFFEFAERLGAEVYVNGNLGSGTVQEMAEWLEYMTSDSQSELAELRRKNGREKPWRVHYFGIGNENWGCGGNMRDEYYADLYRQYRTFLKAPGDNTPKYIATGYYGDQYGWTKTMMTRIPHNLMDAKSLHYYTLATDNWSKKGNATGFGEDEYASTIAYTLRMDDYLTGHIKIMDEHDPDTKVELYVDEWGVWHEPNTAYNPGFLYQQNTMRDAIVASLNLDIFHRYAKRVKMTNIAQMVNVLQAMILTQKEKMVLTPTYHVFHMYRPFQDATFIPVEFKAPTYAHGDFKVPSVSATAARGKDGKLYLAVTNVDPKKPVRFETRLTGAKAKTVQGRLLTAPNVNSYNSFDDPDAVKPVAYEGEVEGGTVILALPAKSIVVVAIE